MTDSQSLPATDTWVKATWEEYLQQIEQPGYKKAKGYYLDGWMRIERLPIGSDHASDHTLVIFAVGLFTTLKGIAAKGLDNCTYRKTGKQECQPDVSYYLGKNVRVIPSGTTVIDLDQYPPPDLVIEVAKISIVDDGAPHRPMDDRTAKRELYESLGVAEYWVLDVEKVQILAYEMIKRGSRRIDESKVLPGLKIETLEQAIRQSRETDHSQVGAWLMRQFQAGEAAL